MARLTHLNALQALETTLRLGSIRSAAEELGITPAAVGQRIKSLEEYLGYPLIQRSRDGVAATPAASEVQGCLRDGFDLLTQVARGLKFDSPNTIHLAADPHWYECWLQPRLDRMADELPYLGVQVETHPDARRRADLIIEFASPDASGKLLFKDYLAPVVTPSVYRLYHDNAGVKILENNALLHLDIYQADRQALNWPGWFRRFGHRTSGFDRGIRHASARHAIDTTLSNSGALLVGLALCLNDIERRALRLLFDPRMGAWTGYGYRVRWQGESRPQLARFLNWLESEAAVTRSDLESLVGSHD